MIKLNGETMLANHTINFTAFEKLAERLNMGYEEDHWTDVELFQKIEGDYD